MHPYSAPDHRSRGTVSLFLALSVAQQKMCTADRTLYTGATPAQLATSGRGNLPVGTAVVNYNVVDRQGSVAETVSRVVMTVEDTRKPTLEVDPISLTAAYGCRPTSCRECGVPTRTGAGRGGRAMRS